MADAPPPSAAPRREGFFAAPLRVDRSTCLVFLDANILLMPYTASAESFSAIKKVYALLCESGRLRIASQAALEFARNRASKISEIHKALSDRRSDVPSRLSSYPALEGLEEYKRLQGIEDAIKAQFKDRRSALDALAAHVKQWAWLDPVREGYAQMFGPEVVVTHTIDEKAFTKLREERYSKKVPPGYKDASKSDGGGGDLAIWLTMMEEARRLQRGVRFITAETKGDWYQRGDGEALFPRYELLEEFKTETGQAFELSSLSELMAEQSAPPEAVKDVKRQEKAIAQSAGVGHWTALNAVGKYMTRQYPGALVHFGSENLQTADVFVSPGHGEDIGVDVVVAQNDSRHRLDQAESLAISKLRNRLFSQMVLFVVAADRQLATSISDRYAELSYWGPGLSVIVGALSGDEVDVVWRSV